LKAKEITPEQDAHIKEIFDRFDVDRDGRISTSELEMVLRELGFKLNHNDVDNMVSLMILFVFISLDIEYFSFQVERGRFRSKWCY